MKNLKLKQIKHARIHYMHTPSSNYTNRYTSQEPSQVALSASNKCPICEAFSNLIDIFSMINLIPNKNAQITPFSLVILTH